MTFVRTKLLLERMEPGQTAQVRLQDESPLKNVPFSVRELGQMVVSLELEDKDGAEFSAHLMIMEKI